MTVEELEEQKTEIHKKIVLLQEDMRVLELQIQEILIKERTEAKLKSLLASLSDEEKKAVKEALINGVTAEANSDSPEGEVN